MRRNARPTKATPPKCDLPGTVPPLNQARGPRDEIQIGEAKAPTNTVTYRGFEPSPDPLKGGAMRRCGRDAVAEAQWARNAKYQPRQRQKSHQPGD